MSFFKVLGGIAAGIGVVAAAPVFGAVGAVSLVGAGVGALAGGVAGSVIAASEEEELDYVRNERDQVLEENAVYSEKMKEVEKYIKKMMNSDIEKTKKIKVIKTLLEAGLLMAWADGTLEDEEKEELIYLLEQFPEYGEYLNRPIKKEKVFESIREVKAVISLNSILSIMYAVGDSDGNFSEEEEYLYMETKNYVELLEDTSNKELLLENQNIDLSQEIETNEVLEINSTIVENEEISTKEMLYLEDVLLEEKTNNTKKFKQLNESMIKIAVENEEISNKKITCLEKKLLEEKTNNIEKFNQLNENIMEISTLNINLTNQILENNSIRIKNEEISNKKLVLLEEKLLISENTNEEKSKQLKKEFNESINQLNENINKKIRIVEDLNLNLNNELLEVKSSLEHSNLMLIDKIEKHEKKHKTVKNIKILLSLILFGGIYYLSI